MNCTFETTDGGGCRCVYCGALRQARRGCAQLKRNCQVVERPPGAGTYLARLFARVGVHAGDDCSCRSLAARMDARGPTWCEQHLAEIVAELQANARQRSLPLPASLARMLVRKAIAFARRQQP